MSTEYIPPRPDAMHPAPLSPTPTPRGLDLRPAADWRWWEALGVFFVGLLIGAIVAQPAFVLIDSEGLRTVVVGLVSDVVMAGTLLLWLRFFHPGWLRVMGFPWPAWGEIRRGALFGAAMYAVIVFGVGTVLMLLLELITGKTVRAPEQVQQDLSAVGNGVQIVFAVLVAPLFEEFFFRGVLFRSIRDRSGFAVGAVVSALVFGSVHYIGGPWQNNLLLMGAMVFVGFALAWLYQRRGNLIAPMAAHVAFNVIGLVLISLLS